MPRQTAHNGIIEMMMTLWHWSLGKVKLDPFKETAKARQLLEESVNAGLWFNVRKFPLKFIAQSLPKLAVDKNSKDFLRLCIKIGHT